MRYYIAALISICIFHLISSSTFAGPADLDLAMQAPNRVIKGATVPIYSYVYNVAPPGSNDLNFSLYYTLPDLSTTTPINRTKAADGGAGYNSYQFDFDSSTAAFGANTFKVNVSDPDAAHSPQAKQLTVQVLDHAVPAMWIGGTEIPMDAVEPSVEPLAFGATGGGESFSASAPHIIGDPDHPTANLDFDSFTSIGDPQITFDLHTLDNILADDAPTAGEAWSIFVDGSVPGHYTKLLYLFFSDEDVPGAVAENSIDTSLYIDVQVTESGVTGFLEVLPEPGSGIVIIIMMSGMGLRRNPTHRT